MISKKDYECPQCEGDKEVAKDFGSRFIRFIPCPSCNGTGLNEDARAGLKLIQAMKDDHGIQIETDNYKSLNYNGRDGAWIINDGEEDKQFDSPLAALHALLGASLDKDVTEGGEKE